MSLKKAKVLTQVPTIYGNHQDWLDKLMRISLVLILALGLGAISATFPAEPLPPVFFNHATIFVSPTVYDALARSEFLRNEFSGFKEQTVQRDGGKWSYTGIFIFGQHTYLEFFKAGHDDPHLGTPIPGQLIFNMWIDDRSQLPRFMDRLAEESGSTLLMDTARNGQNQPMYDTVISKGGPASDFGPGMRIDTHLKGYYPDGITREQRLKPVFVPERQLQDITAFALTVDEAERKRLLHQFRAYSYGIGGDEAKQVVSGPGITFELMTAKPKAPRTLVIEFSLNRPTEGEQTYKLDESDEIHIQGNTGKWVLTFPKLA